MAAPFTIGAATDMINPAVQKMFIKFSPKHEEFWRKFYNITTGVTDYNLIDSSISGLGEAARISENAVIVSEAPVQGFDKTYTQIEYGKLMSFTKKMWKFGIKKRDMTRIVSALKQACIDKRERLLHEKLDAAWLNSYSHSDDAGNFTLTTTGGDAVSLANASHTREDGGTAWSNIVSDGTTANLAFDYAGMKGAYRVAALVKSPKGAPMPMHIDNVIVKEGSAAHFKAAEIKGAISKGKIPEEFSNDGSAVGDFNIIATPWLLGTGDATSISNLSAATNWHAFDSRYIGDEYGLQYFESEPISMSSEPNIVFKTNEIQYKASMMFAFGHNDARGIFCSQGDNS